MGNAAMQTLVCKIREEGQRKGLVDNGSEGHSAIWNMLVEQLPEEAFQTPQEISWIELLSAPIIKTT